MDKAQTDRMSEVPAAPQEERAARHLRMLARAADIHMEVMEATRTEAVEAPQPGIDYGQRIAVVTKSLRLTLLLEDKFAGHRDERRKAAARRESAQADWHDLRVKLAMLAAACEVSEQDEEVDRSVAEVCERVERPEVSEFIEASRPEVAVAALCRRWNFPPQVERWLDMADEAMEHYGFIPPEDGEDDEDDPQDPPEPCSAAPARRKPKPWERDNRRRTRPFTNLQHPRTQPSTLPLPLREGWGRGLRASAPAAYKTLVIPAKAGISSRLDPREIPAFAGMTARRKQ
ncbi:MAG: hypothetical protein JF625_24000 [Inquilinus limosus]|uniref:Uncharacterized protein n=1 Tax=Inquilinus limosus TaxID=171674 RepID=A0A952KJW4_9PROT|nr:hypothetical protein [Inquilinus limosus]